MGVVFHFFVSIFFKDLLKFLSLFICDFHSHIFFVRCVFLFFFGEPVWLHKVFLIFIFLLHTVSSVVINVIGLNIGGRVRVKYTWLYHEHF